MTVTIRTSCVLLDLDGVLVDSSAAVYQAWAAWAGQHGLDPAATFAVGHGRSTLDHIRAVSDRLATEAEADRIDELEREHVASVVAQPGAGSFCRQLAGSRWGIVTSCSRSAAVARLDAAGLATPEILVCIEDVARGKPAPDPYREGAHRLGVPARETVVFEDAPAGVTAARAARSTVVALTTTHAYGELGGADFIIPDLSHASAIPDAGTGSVELTLRPAAAPVPRSTRAQRSPRR
jgi:mannitol-1-/sugar-/sorbitol-6-phosphatase